MTAQSAQTAGNRETLKKLLVVVALMGGFGYALVPFYKTICEITGINQLVKADARPSNTQVDLTRKVTIEVDTLARIYLLGVNAKL
ncbi:MAG: cytochrome c oxidase assembly protein, partial [Deltaproteobacteria bacterium]